MLRDVSHDPQLRAYGFVLVTLSTLGHSLMLLCLCHTNISFLVISAGVEISVNTVLEQAKCNNFLDPWALGFG